MGFVGGVLFIKMLIVELRVLVVYVYCFDMNGHWDD